MDREPATLPFTENARTFVEEQGHGLDELIENDEFADTRTRAEDRVMDALKGDPGLPPLRTEAEITREALSYPLARVMVSCIDDRYLINKFASAEAERATETTTDYVYHLESFGYDVDDRSISVPDYLRLTTRLHGDEWRLVNRSVDHGRVTLKPDDLPDLFQAAARTAIGENLPLPVAPDLCQKLAPHLERIQTEVEERSYSAEELELEESCFPPCIAYHVREIERGENLTHTARFAVTSFLMTLGLDVDEVVDMFNTSPDFDEEKTRYQVEHIAGSTGSSYTPPSCGTMKTYGNCPGEDRWCKHDTVTHPLSYYRWALKRREHAQKKDGEKENAEKDA